NARSPRCMICCIATHSICRRSGTPRRRPPSAGRREGDAMARTCRVHGAAGIVNGTCAWCVDGPRTRAVPVEPPAVPAEPDAAALRAALLALYRGIEDLVDVQDGGWRSTDEASAAREHERWRDAW